MLAIGACMHGACLARAGRGGARQRAPAVPRSGLHRSRMPLVVELDGVAAGAPGLGPGASSKRHSAVPACFGAREGLHGVHCAYVAPQAGWTGGALQATSRAPHTNRRGPDDWPTIPRAALQTDRGVRAASAPAYSWLRSALSLLAYLHGRAAILNQSRNVQVQVRVGGERTTCMGGLNG